MGAPCETWKAWLPEEALGNGIVERLIGEAVEHLSAKWFGRGAMRPFGRLKPTHAGVHLAGPDEQWHMLDDGLAVWLSGKSQVRLAGLMLDASIDRKALQPADRQLIERLAKGCIDDLLARLTRLFKLPPNSSWRTGDGEPPSGDMWSCEIGVDDREPLIRLFIKRDLVISLIKSSIPVAPAPILLQPLSAGLAGQPVHVSARLGRCEIPLAQLANLAEGDVLVLDRALTHRLEAAIDGRAKHGRCIVEQEGEQLLLKFVEPLGG